MKKSITLLLASIALVSGCATTSGSADGLSVTKLQTERYFRGNEVFFGTFVDVQRNVLASNEQCNTTSIWRLVDNEVNYATVVYQPHEGASLADSVLIYLTAYSNGKLQAEVFSYYAAQQQAARDALQLIQKPTACPQFTS